MESEGSPDEAARAVAGDEALAAHVLPRVRKIWEALRALRTDTDLKRCFAKLPAGYEDILLRAHRVVAGG